MVSQAINATLCGPIRHAIPAESTLGAMLVPLFRRSRELLEEDDEILVITGRT